MPATMARQSLLLPLVLALLALYLLALPRDARARPGDRKVGERQDLSPNDPQVRKATQAAMATYNMGSNSIYYFRDTTILRAQSQVRPAGGAGRGRERRARPQPGRRWRGRHKSNQPGILIQHIFQNPINSKTSCGTEYLNFG